MRSITTTETRERGATLVLVAASMIMVMALAALTIDLGNGWRTRRGLIPATDSAALAAAQGYVDGENGCGTIYDGYVAANWPDPSTVHSCQRVQVSSEQGYVIVDADTNVETWFAEVIGAGDFRVRSHSAALYAPPNGVTGLRPIGICLASNPDVVTAINLSTGSSMTVTVTYGKDQPDACGLDGDIPGNWGIVDFDAGSNPIGDIRDWLRDGYPDPVYFGDHAVSSCGSEAHCYSGDPGAASNSLGTELAFLRDTGIFFTVPVFNFAEGNGGGALFHLSGAIRVRLVDFKVTGAQADRYFTFEVQPGLITGECCNGGGNTGANQVVILCAVDPGDYAACTP